MFERAFTFHTTDDGITIGLGALWQNDQLFQMDLIETGGETAWLQRIPETGRTGTIASETRSSALWANIRERLEGKTGTHPGERARHGTAFQRQVWEALATIPCGEVRTYKAIAQSIGIPDGARAVASACASNPIALIVPCHRVVGAQGKLGGYRWGVALKRRQLEMEGANR